MAGLTTVVITNGDSGLAGNIALASQHKGFHVLSAARDRSAPSQMGSTQFFPVDVNQASSVENFVAGVERFRESGSDLRQQRFIFVVDAHPKFWLERFKPLLQINGYWKHDSYNGCFDKYFVGIAHAEAETAGMNESERYSQDRELIQYLTTLNTENLPHLSSLALLVGAADSQSIATTLFDVIESGTIPTDKRLRV